LLCKLNGCRWTRLRTGGIPPAQIALCCFTALRQGMYRTEGTGEGAQVTPNTELTQYDLRSGLLIEGDGVHWTSIHAPRFVALHTRIGCVARLFIKDIDTDEALRRLKGSGLYPGARQLALPASGTAGGYDFERFGH
jgi:hypothetical protein